jgi:Holliday junction resolvase RusA-like endonuclease
VSIKIRVEGVPGPKGSVNAFCVRCAQRHLPQKTVIKEESENGKRMRLLIKRAARHLLAEPLTGPVETRLTVYVPRRRKVLRGVELDEWVPSHAGPYPIHQQSGDAEKHVRNLHDALMDAGILADDSIVARQSSEKLWADEANPPGVVFEVIPL